MNNLEETTKGLNDLDGRLRRIETTDWLVWKSACSPFLALPGLRGFWPMSAFGATGQAFDQSGNGRTLTYNGNPTYNFDGWAPYIDLDGTGDFLSRPDEAGLDILGTETYVAAARRGLTMGGWWYLDRLIATQILMNKRNAANDGYSLRAEAAGTVSAVFGSGAAQTFFTTTGTTTVGVWVFIATRFDPSTDVTIWIDDARESVATAIAALNNSTANFDIGNGAPVAGNDLDGRASLCFLCAAALSDAIIQSLFERTRALFGV